MLRTSPSISGEISRNHGVPEPPKARTAKITRKKRRFLDGGGVGVEVSFLETPEKGLFERDEKGQDQSGQLSRGRRVPLKKRGATQRQGGLCAKAGQGRALF